MNALIHIALPERLNAWHNKSGVGHCTTCDGIGHVASQRHPTINDPYPETECTDCYGMDQACKVCGFDIQVTGYDCLVCQTVAELPDDALNPVSAVHMAASVNRAITASVRGGEVNQPIPDARWMAQAGVR